LNPPRQGSSEARHQTTGVVDGCGELFPHVKPIVRRAGEYPVLGNTRLQFHLMLYTSVLRDLQAT